MPTVASTAAGATACRIVAQRVVRPPSARMTSSAPYPRTPVSAGVVEPEPEAALTDEQPEREVEQQGGQPAARGEPHRDDGDEQHGRTSQQDDPEVVDRHARPPPATASPAPGMPQTAPLDAARVPRRRVLRLSLLGVGTLLVVVLLVAFVTTVVVVRRSFPTQDGTLSLPGLSAPVTVIRDDARRAADLRANRRRPVPCPGVRAGAGQVLRDGLPAARDRRRLSELVGTSDEALQADKVVRTLGWRQVAQQELDQADPTTRRYLDDYARGVNDYITHPVTVRAVAELHRPRARPHAVADRALDPARLRLPGSRRWPGTCAATTTTSSPGPGSWARSRTSTASTSSTRPTPTRSTPRSSAAGENQAATATPAAAASLTRAAAASLATGGSGIPVAAPGRGAGGRRTAPALRPRADASGLLAALTSTAGQRSLVLAQQAVAAVPNLLGGGADGVGSNSWVVSGALTTTGKPLLANDPHLGPGIPGTWYQMGLHCEPLSDACPYRRRRLHLLRRPGSDHRAHPAHRLGHDEPRARRHRLLPGEAQRERVPARRQGGPADDAAGDDRRRRRVVRDDHGAVDGRRSPAVRRHRRRRPGRAAGSGRPRSPRRAATATRSRSSGPRRLRATTWTPSSPWTRHRTSPRSGPRCSSSTSQRRTSSTRTSTGTSATRPQAGSRSAAPTCPASPCPPTAPGRCRDGIPATTGPATCRPRSCRGRRIRRRASSSPRTSR